MILFRCLETNLPDNWYPNVHWYVEHHDDGYDMSFPTGIAFVSHFPDWREVPLTMVDFIMVPDMHRRQGIATKLITAIMEKWPHAHLTDAISKDGEELLKSLGLETF